MDLALKLALSVLLAALKDSVKNPTRRAKLKTVLLEVRDQIDFLYNGEELTASKSRAAIAKLKAA